MGKPPLVAIIVANDEKMRADILAGRKRITIREGWRDYTPNTTVMLCCHLAPWCVQATITAVRQTHLNLVTQEEMRADGFRSYGEMYEALRRYYPNLAGDAPVTVIQWHDVRGTLVDTRE